jgi:hypothetical protein
LDLDDLSRRTGIERRKLRYVLDHELVPRRYIEIFGNKAGRPRNFDSDVAFGIVCAARLLDLGLPHAMIRLFLGGLLEIKLKSKDNAPALSYILQSDLRAIAELGDGDRVRLLLLPMRPGAGRPSAVGRGGARCLFDSGWIAAGKHRRVREFPSSPTVVVSLDLARIRDQVFARK